jgi:hypothetical protein
VRGREVEQVGPFLATFNPHGPSPYPTASSSSSRRPTMTSAPDARSRTSRSVRPESSTPARSRRLLETGGLLVLARTTDEILAA